MSDHNKVMTPRVLILLFIFIVVVPFLPLLLSQRWNWWEAWIFFLIYVLGFVISRALAARRHPDLLAERAHFMCHQDAKSWDKVLSPLVGLGGAFIPLTAGLEARWHWSYSLALPIKILALLLILGGFTLASLALIENRFFSGMVRIQKDRDHKPISSGPYRWLRHPGYTGALVSYLGTPLLLNSNWTFVPVLFLGVVLIIRTNLEDKTLRTELSGYEEYAQQVRYRLLPGIW
ncbi:isoprenylcysteine carboxylmethyltransferase family protein [bacterium]|nr:isoprenylcysteine carboxylmethyltransferase family protein [bacterium]